MTGASISLSIFSALCSSHSQSIHFSTEGHQSDLKKEKKRQHHSCGDTGNCVRLRMNAGKARKPLIFMD